MFGWLSRRRPPASEADPPADPYFERMGRLGLDRWRVVVCTWTHSPSSPHYFDPPEGADLDEAFREHLERLWALLLPGTSGPQWCGMAVVAAGLLSYGRLEMAGYVLDWLPDRFIRNGICHHIARRIAAAVLPLPEGLRDWEAWIEGTPEAEAVRSWFADHRDSLRWEPSSCVFALGGPST